MKYLHHEMKMFGVARCCNCKPMIAKSFILLSWDNRAENVDLMSFVMKSCLVMTARSFTYYTHILRTYCISGRPKNGTTFDRS